MRRYFPMVSAVALSVLLSSLALVAAVDVAGRGPGTDLGNVHPAPPIGATAYPAPPVPTPGIDPRNPDPLLNYCATVWLGTDYPGGPDDAGYDACVAPLGQ